MDETKTPHWTDILSRPLAELLDDIQAVKDAITQAKRYHFAAANLAVRIESHIKMLEAIEARANYPNLDRKLIIIRLRNMEELS